MKNANETIDTHNCSQGYNLGPPLARATLETRLAPGLSDPHVTD